MSVKAGEEEQAMKIFGIRTVIGGGLVAGAAALAWTGAWILAGIALVGAIAAWARQVRDDEPSDAQAAAVLVALCRASRRRAPSAEWEHRELESRT
jgi:hypothetical protein